MKLSFDFTTSEILISQLVSTWGVFMRAKFAFGSLKFLLKSDSCEMSAAKADASEHCARFDYSNTALQIIQALSFR